MKKFLYICLLMLLPLAASAQIKPQSIGTYKHYDVGGPTDIFVSLTYNTDATYFAYSLREMHYNNRFVLMLGNSKEEALESLNNLLNILKTGEKGEVYVIDENTSMKKVDNTRLNIYRAGQLDYGYIQSRHIKSTIKFINNL